MKRLYCETHKFSNYAHRVIIDDEIKNENKLVGYVPVYPLGGFFPIDDENCYGKTRLLRFEKSLEDIDGDFEKLDFISNEVAKGYQLAAIVPIEYGVNSLAVKFDLFFQRTYDALEAKEILDLSDKAVENMIEEFSGESLWEEIVAFYSRDQVYREDAEFMNSFIARRIKFDGDIHARLEYPEKFREFFWYILDNGYTKISENEVVAYYKRDNLYELYIKYLTYCIIDKVASDCVKHSYFHDSESADDEDDEIIEEEREFLKDFAIFKGMQKRLVEAFDLYNANNGNSEFREFQKEFLCALNDLSNGCSVDSYNINMSYEGEYNTSCVTIDLSDNYLCIWSGGFEKNCCGGDSYTNWNIDFYAEGEIDNSHDIELESFDVFSEILGAEEVRVEFS